MDSKKLVFNNETYNILTSIKMGQTAFLICIDLLDNKVIYFKQEIIEGKVKLTSPTNIVTTANDVNKKSLSNKKRILDAFIPKVSDVLAKTVFVDRAKVTKAFNNLTTEIDNCDLKYYMIDNASIEETDEQIQNLMYKFNGMNFNKDLENVNEIKNELYYFTTNEEKKVEPKIESVTNANRIETAPADTDDNSYSGPSVASDPFKTGNINLDEIANSLDQGNSVDAALNKHLEQYAPKKEDLEQTPEQKQKAKRLNLILIVVAILAVGASLYFTVFKKDKTYSTNAIMEKANAQANLKEIDEGTNYNAPDDISETYQKALNNKLINVNVANLKTLNGNTIGWIRSDFLSIDYPFAKGTFYSNHDYLDGESGSGWIYLDGNTDLNKIDRNNVIYGRSDVNSTFFYSLKKVLTPDFAKDVNNQVIKISTADADTLWLVFSVYEIPNEDYYSTNEFKDDAAFEEFLDTINERSVHDFNVDLDKYDKVLTLSTNKNNENRIIVHAKLIKINSRVEVKEEEDKKDEEVKEDKEEEKKDEETKEDNEQPNPEENKEEEKNGENN